MAEPNFDLGFSLEDDIKTSRFDNKSKKEQNDMMEDRHKESTRRATRGAMNILSDYLEEKQLQKFEEITDVDLPDILLDFYSNLKKAKGGDYKLQTLKCIRAGLNRYTKEHRGLDIINDTRFAKTNEMFKAVSTQARKKGLGSTKSTPPIEEDDMPLISAYLQHDIMNKPDPRKLQKYVLFNIIYYFCRRGRQNIHDFTQDVFQIGYDPDGTKYVYQALDEADKNHGIDESLPANDGRMYETPESQWCPINTFQLYVSKLHKSITYFWQRPKRGKIHYTDQLWYDKIRVGHEPIENFMAILSQEARLSKRYTNHSIRSTVMGILGEKYEGCKVIGLSGHKLENTVKQYIRRLPSKTKKEMSDTLADNVVPKKQPKTNDKPFTFRKSSATATVSKVPEQSSDVPPDPTLQVIQLDPEPIQEENATNNQENMEFQLQAIDDAPPDEVLMNFLSQFDPATGQHMEVQAPTNQQAAPQPLQPNNTMNISTVKNVQNVQENQAKMPNMFFGGNSTVTINYNFGPTK